MPNAVAGAICVVYFDDIPLPVQSQPKATIQQKANIAKMPFLITTIMSKNNAAKIYGRQANLKNRDRFQLKAGLALKAKPNPLLTAA